ncbi:MAG: hypothetical protein BVN31_11305, partial [Proteobacteria bacterium ST_bin15]
MILINFFCRRPLHECDTSSRWHALSAKESIMKADWVVTTALLGALTMTQAFAADLAAGPEVPAAVKAEPGPWQVRLRGIYVLPEFSNRTLTVNAAPLAGARIGVTDSIIPELDITYYFTKNIAAELILAVTRHTAYGAGSIAALGSLGVQSR